MTPDYTPNEATAAKLGWKLKDKHEVPIEQRWWLEAEERERLLAERDRRALHATSAAGGNR